jgi:hypothetical protein
MGNPQMRYVKGLLMRKLRLKGTDATTMHFKIGAEMAAADSRPKSTPMPEAGTPGGQMAAWLRRSCVWEAFPLVG